MNTRPTATKATTKNPISLEKDYIQLPPLKKDTPSDVIAFMWEYMKVPEDSREKVKNLSKDANENGVKISHQAPTLYDVVPKEEIAEFEELMRKTIADIVSEASSVACWVYVQKYVKHKTLNEMLQELPDVSQFILAMDTWFEKLMVIEAIIEADNEMQRIKDKIGMLHEI